MSAQNSYSFEDDIYNDIPDLFVLPSQQEENQQVFLNMDTFPSPSACSNDTFQTELQLGSHVFGQNVESSQTRLEDQSFDLEALYSNQNELNTLDPEVQFQTDFFQISYEQNQIQNVEPNQTRQLELENDPLDFDLKDLKFTPTELKFLDQFTEYQTDLQNGCAQIGNQNEEPVDLAHIPAQSSSAHSQMECYLGPGSNYSSHSESSQIFSIDSYYQNGASTDDRSVFSQPMSNSSQLSEANQETEFESPNSNYSTQSAGSASKPSPNEKYRNKKLTKISSTEKEIKRLAHENNLIKKKINSTHAVIQALKDECLKLNMNITNISNYSLENLECDNEAGQEQEQQTTENETFRCEYCQLEFKSKRGVSIHKSSCKKN